MGLGFAAAGGIMWGRGQYLARMARRTNRYTNAIGEAEAMPLDEIAKRVNRSPAKAARELQKLIDKGYLGEDAYIDRERGYFLRFGATVEEEEPEEAAPPPPQGGGGGLLRYPPGLPPGSTTALPTRPSAGRSTAWSRSAP